MRRRLALDRPGILIWMPVEGDVEVHELAKNEGERARLADHIYNARPDCAAIALAARAAAERRTFSEIIETLAATPEDE